MQVSSTTDIDRLARQLSADSIRATTAAGSGHPTSCLSAADLVATLLARHIRIWPDEPEHPGNDRLIFSKGHAAPLLYAGLVALGRLDVSQLDDLRRLDSPLEGHPVPGLPHIPIATGSLGQGLANGLGFALANRTLGSTGTTWVLLGDSEMAEGAVWESMALASHYSLTNLIAVIDVNRLGQRGPTMHEWDTDAYEQRAHAFGWDAAVCDGHDPDDITRRIEEIQGSSQPGMLIARTVKGNGVSFLADQPDRHGKALTEGEAARAISELHYGERQTIRVLEPREFTLDRLDATAPELPDLDGDIATRDAFGLTLAAVVKADPLVLVLDGEVSDSTRTKEAGEAVPRQFIQMYIAEQAMVGAAVGIQATGMTPVVSTFAAFLTRAHDFIRMAAISQARMVLNGSHAGVSIGEDGPSQMGLDDVAMMRATPGTAVLSPADGYSTAALLALALDWPRIAYIRTQREETPQIYPRGQTFSIGGSHTLRSSADDQVTIVGTGVTVHEALAAADALDQEGIAVRVIDAYSVEPLDTATVRRAMDETGLIVVAEDHSRVGGLGDAVLDAVAAEPSGQVIKLGVDQFPGSATPQEQRDRVGISAAGMKETVVEMLSQRALAQ